MRTNEIVYLHLHDHPHPHQRYRHLQSLMNHQSQQEIYLIPHPTKAKQKINETSDWIRIDQPEMQRENSNSIQ